MLTWGEIFAVDAATVADRSLVLLERFLTVLDNSSTVLVSKTTCFANPEMIVNISICRVTETVSPFVNSASLMSSSFSLSAEFFSRERFGVVPSIPLLSSWNQDSECGAPGVGDSMSLSRTSVSEAMSTGWRSWVFWVGCDRSRGVQVG